ncbi:hypothetical protein IP69_16320 [Bosea sp. AAP35]|uniref:type II toxin-antitoxin system VapB family antitoxin n=1 Tax=Bosea sp. AAP35 TaxID=1523417 RepID=UPI0006B91A06|nr:type II toxin-antitoxin system VapB family antitoxin [Bosea sp. AAP35]KPF65918.1 hypothetical protein IP69_16320 [Bosea sp. AAP35]
MAILIKDAETDRIVRELAARTGRTIKDAVRFAAERELSELPRGGGRIDHVKLEETLARLRSYPVTDNRTAEEILGYDENGLPA